MRRRRQSGRGAAAATLLLLAAAAEAGSKRLVLQDERQDEQADRQPGLPLTTWQVNLCACVVSILQGLHKGFYTALSCHLVCLTLLRGKAARGADLTELCYVPET